MLTSSPSRTVLLVEDQDQLRTLTTRILQRGGFQVISASGADEAFAILREHAEEINILLSDVVMPDVDGITLAQEVHDRFPEIKIILMSGYGASDLKVAGAFQWMDVIISKPFTAETLVEAVRRAA